MEQKQPVEKEEDEFEAELKRVLNIDGKLKKAMQVLVQQQKKSNLVDQIKQDKVQKKKMKKNRDGIIQKQELDKKKMQKQENHSSEDSFNLLQKHISSSSQLASDQNLSSSQANNSN